MPGRVSRLPGLHGALLGRLLAVLALAAASLVFLGGPAQACSCAMVPTSRLVEGADQVFTGSVTSVDAPAGTQHRVFTVAVDRAYKGEVSPVMRVATNAQPSACGLDVPEGTPYLFLTTSQGVYAGRGDDASGDDVVFTGSCSGSEPAAKPTLARIEKAIGPGQVAASPSPDHAVRADSDDPDEGLPAWPFIGGVVLIALVAGTITARRTT